MRISTVAPTATAYLSMVVVSVGRVRTPFSRRDTTPLVVHILAGTSSCVIPAATRAATRPATSACNVRSVVSARVGRFLRPAVSEARLRARTWEGSSIAELGAAPDGKQKCYLPYAEVPTSRSIELGPNWRRFRVFLYADRCSHFC